MLWLERQCIGAIQSNLRNFTEINSNTFNFSCPLCGDSLKHKHRARAYIYQTPGEDRFSFKCHNCGKAYSFITFIKLQFPTTYNTLRLEIFREGNKAKKIVTKKEETSRPVPTEASEELEKLLQPVNQLGKLHAVSRYLIGRGITDDRELGIICWTPDIRQLIESCNKLFGTQYDSSGLKHEPRIIFPMRWTDGKIFGFQSRIFGTQTTKGGKYITYLFDPTKPKLFGLDRVDLKKRVHILEGPVDSLFVDNAIASCGSDLLSPWIIRNVPKHLRVLVFDNEPRSKIIIKKIEQAVDAGENVVIWKGIESNLKDINDLLKSGISRSRIQSMIDERIVSGLNAQITLSAWKKLSTGYINSRTSGPLHHVAESTRRLLEALPSN